MDKQINLEKVYIPSEKVVAREIHGEFIIVPIHSGLDEEASLFSLNETGQEIWKRLDGKKTLKQVAENLRQEFEGTAEELQTDVLGLGQELLKREMIIEASSGK